MSVVILAIDGSHYSIATTQAMLSHRLLQRPLDVHLVDACPPVSGRSRAFFSLEQIQAEAKREANHAFAAVRPLLQADGASITEHWFLEEEPATAILELARAYAADVIVVGTHSRHPVFAALLGSVALQVVTNAPIPVLVIGSRRV